MSLEQYNERAAADREVRITYISSFSFAAITSLGSSIYGIISGMVTSFTLIKASEANGKLPNLTAAFVIQDMFFAGGLYFVCWLVIGFLAGGLLAGLFNMIARTTGGLQIRMRFVDNP